MGGKATVMVDEVTLRKKGAGQRIGANREGKRSQGPRESDKLPGKERPGMSCKEEERPGREGGIWGPRWVAANRSGRGGPKRGLTNPV